MTYYPDQLREWRARRRAIADHYRQSCSLRATGQAFGISGERVRQIVIMEDAKDGQDNAGRSDPQATDGAGRHG